MTSDKTQVRQGPLGRGLRKNEILRGYSVFRTILRSGRRLDGELVRCAYTRNPQLGSGWLFGFTVSSRYYKATQRNRIKRLFREAVASQRRRWRSSNVSLSLVVELRRGIVRRVRFSEIERDVERICKTLMNEFCDQ